jgi:HAAS domain-containing protein
MKSTADKLVDDYLDRLNRELTGFPRARRRELVEEISGHIAEARADLETENEAAIRTLLDRLGDPADIAAEARERPAPARLKGSGWDVVALILLLIGGVILPVVGWLIGVVILWGSATWTTREKLIGTLIVPFGLALPTFLLTIGTSAQSCSDRVGLQPTCTDGGVQIGDILGAVLSVGLILASIASVIFLARRRSRAVALA